MNTTQRLELDVLDQSLIRWYEKLNSDFNDYRFNRPTLRNMDITPIFDGEYLNDSQWSPARLTRKYNLSRILPHEQVSFWLGCEYKINLEDVYSSDGTKLMLHASESVCVYGDRILDVIIQLNLCQLESNPTLLTTLSGILINTTIPICGLRETFICLMSRSNDILKFLLINGHSKSYKDEIIIKWVNCNCYSYTTSFENLVELFPPIVISTVYQTEVWCKEVISSNQKAVEDFRSGRKGALNSLKGQVMKLSKGTAAIQEVGNILENLILDKIS